MSVEQKQRTVNGLDSEVANLEKKKATVDKEIANLQSKIISIQKSITKNTSQTIRNNKIRTIKKHESDMAKLSIKSAELGKKIANKKKKLYGESLKLQKEQQVEEKSQQRKIQDMQETYKSLIEELQEQVLKTAALQQSTNKTGEEYDVFISHACEDKEEFVDEFVLELRKQGLKVWYDTDEVGWGDSLRKNIDAGLSKSRYGVVILSLNYINKQKYWTNAEMNGLFQMETIRGKVILPIWHKLTKEQVIKYSPILADRKALSTETMTAAEIAAVLKQLFTTENMEEQENG